MKRIPVLLSKLWPPTSLRAALIIPLLLQIVIVGAVGWLSFQNGRQSVDDLALRLQQEVTGRIQEHLNAYLETPHLINEISAEAIRLNLLDTNDPAALERYFWQQAQTFNTIRYVYWGNPEGGIVLAGRDDDGRPIVRTNEGFVSGPYIEYLTDAQGQRIETRDLGRNYDARERPWYQAAVASQQPHWSSIYPFFTDATLGISASRPVYGPDGNLLGVLSSDLTLGNISHFLNALTIDADGQAIIIDRQGQLVASSLPEQPLLNSEGNPLLALQSELPLVSTAVQTLLDAQADLTRFDSEQNLSFSLDNQPHYLQVTAMQDTRGLDWLILVIVPETAFMERITANTRITIALTGLAFAAALIFAVLITRWVVRPVQAMNSAAQALGEGTWHDPGPVRRRDELGQLLASFNHMAGRLQQSMRTLVQSEEKYRRLVEDSQDAIIITTLDGRIVDGNAAAEQLFGYARSEWPQLNVERLYVNPADRQAFLEKLTREGAVSDFELDLKTRTGTGLNCIISTSARRDEAGNIIGLQNIIHDVSARKQAEMALQAAYDELEQRVNDRTQALSKANQSLEQEISERKHSLALLEAALESTTEGVLIVDNQGALVVHNQVFEEIWQLPAGWDRYPARSQRMSLLMAQVADPAAFEARVNDLITQPEVDAYDLIELKDGRTLERFSRPYRLGEEIIGRVWTFRDITARRQSEAALQQLNEDLAGRVNQLATLNRITQTVAAELDLITVLEVVAREMTILFGARNTGIALFDETGEELTVVAEYSHNPDAPSPLGVKIPVTNNPSTEYVLNTKRSISVSDVQHNLLTEPIHALMKARGTQSLIIVPLLTRGNILGTIGVDTDEAGRVFSSDEVSLAETVAGQLAGAIERARLFDAERRRASEMTSLAEVSREITLSLNPNTVLDRVATQAYNLLNASNVTIYLQQDDSGILRGVVAHGEHKAQTEAHTIQLGEGLLGRTAAGGQAHIFNEIDPEIPATLPKDPLLCVPLITRGQTIGLLALWRPADSGGFTPNDLSFVEGLARQASVSIENAQLYQNLQSLNQQMQAELRLASEIQRNLLPPSRPNWPTLDVLGYTRPVNEVGGDFYDYHQFVPTPEQQHFALAVGDISGKGMPAALLMATSLAHLDSLLSRPMSPARRLAVLDSALVPYTRTTRNNCALCYVELRRPTRAEVWNLQVVNAGCIAPYIKRRNGDVIWLDVGGIPLGIGAGAEAGYQEAKETLTPGDMLIMTSDGVAEANNTANEIFGFARLEAAIRRGPQQSAEAMVEHLAGVIAAFVGEATPHDDLTIVVVQI